MVALPRIIVKRWPDAGVDVLVNNAGMGRNNAALFDGSTASWVEMISTNVLGVCMCTREAIQVSALCWRNPWTASMTLDFFHVLRPAHGFLRCLGPCLLGVIVKHRLMHETWLHPLHEHHMREALSVASLAALLQDMKRRGSYGHVINISSMSAHRVANGASGGGFYAATKHALKALTESLRQEVRLALPSRPTAYDVCQAPLVAR